MPYIHPIDRNRFNNIFNSLRKLEKEGLDLGTLYYIIWRICTNYFDNSNKKYLDRIDVVAALEGSKLEWIRRNNLTYVTDTFIMSPSSVDVNIDDLNYILSEIENNRPRDNGELNFLIYKLCKTFIKFNPYKDLITVSFMLETIKFEWYLKYLADYEDEKILENGDIV